MTTEDFFDKSRRGWMCVGKLSEISPTDDTDRGFLEALSRFRTAEAQGQIDPDKGYPMPNTRGIIVGSIVELDFMIESSTFQKPDPTDGIIFVKQVTSQPE